MSSHKDKERQFQKRFRQRQKQKQEAAKGRTITTDPEAAKEAEQIVASRYPKRITNPKPLDNDC